MTTNKTQQRTAELEAKLVADFIRLMEQGTAPWQHPVIKQAGGMPLRANGESYTGGNVLTLWMAAIEHGFTARHWMTYNQAKALGGQVRAGEKSRAHIFLPMSIKVQQEDPNAEDKFFMRFKPKAVFNVCQIDGLPDMYQAAPEELRDNPPCAPLDTFFANCGSSVQLEGSNRCFYRRNTDTIHMPALNRFRSSQSYYATLAHEHVHWTGAPHRLDRTKGKAFADPAYAFEELIAELGSAFLLTSLGVMPCDTASHASYLDSWMQALRDDGSLLRKAASDASKAVSYMQDMQQQQPTALAA